MMITVAYVSEEVAEGAEYDPASPQPLWSEDILVTFTVDTGTGPVSHTKTLARLEFIAMDGQGWSGLIAAAVLSTREGEPRTQPHAVEESASL